MSDANHVSSSTPKVGGAVHRAPLGSTLPTDATTELDAAFVSLGYISEDGLTNSNSPETSDTKAWGGAVVMSSLTGRPDTFKFKLLEGLNAAVLKVSYGDEQVSGTLDTGLTIKAGPVDMERSSYAVEMIMKDGTLKRIVIPDAAVTAVGDITYKSGDPVGYEITLTAYPDTSGFTHYEYMKKGAA